MTSRYLILLLCLSSLSAQTKPAGNLSNTITTYCSGCHNGQMRSASRTLLERFDPSTIAAQPEMWAAVYRQLQAGTMPPAGAPRPSRALYDATLVEIERALGVQPQAATGEQIAARLATLLWNAVPDAALTSDVSRLRDAATREKHVRRMLADDRALSFVERFFLPWLQLDRLSQDTRQRDLFLKETTLFVIDQLRADRDPVELWTADYTFLNEQLAKHYGIDDVTGAQFRQVKITTPDRTGLMGHASVLTLTSPVRTTGKAFTSPAARGRWVLAHLLGVHPPNPAPNAQPVSPDLPITPQTRVLPSDPCLTCHSNFFPLGYGLEQFDTEGRLRTHDQAGPVDATGAIVDGTKFDGVVQMRRALLQRSDAFRTSITESLLIFAAGGPAKHLNGTPDTLMRARQILREMKDPRWTALIAAVVE